MNEWIIGKPAPLFTLPDGEGREVSLADYRGRHVVLYFYPQDMTPTCTQQSCDFRDYNGKFADLNTAVIGISPDSVLSHGKFAAKYGLDFTLLSDEERKVCELYGVWQLKKLYGREYMGVVRSTFLIDREGTAVREWTKVRIKGHVQQVLDAAAQLQLNG